MRFDFPRAKHWEIELNAVLPRDRSIDEAAGWGDEIVATPFLGEIRMVGFNFAPLGWAFASGQVLPISQNNALFVLIGTTYGGDGQTTFALPDIRSRMPMHFGQGIALSPRSLGQNGGSESTTFPSMAIPGAPVAPIQALSSPAPQVGSISPFLVINFIIALQGIFPSQT